MWTSRGLRRKLSSQFPLTSDGLVCCDPWAGVDLCTRVIPDTLSLCDTHRAGTFLKPGMAGGPQSPHQPACLLTATQEAGCRPAALRVCRLVWRACTGPSVTAPSCRCSPCGFVTCETLKCETESARWDVAAVAWRPGVALVACAGSLLSSVWPLPVPEVITGPRAATAAGGGEGRPPGSCRVAAKAEPLGQHGQAPVSMSLTCVGAHGSSVLAPACCDDKNLREEAMAHPFPCACTGGPGRPFPSLTVRRGSCMHSFHGTHTQVLKGEASPSPLPGCACGHPGGGGLPPAATCVHAGMCASGSGELAVVCKTCPGLCPPLPKGLRQRRGRERRQPACRERSPSPVTVVHLGTLCLVTMALASLASVVPLGPGTGACAHLIAGNQTGRLLRAWARKCVDLKPGALLSPLVGRGEARPLGSRPALYAEPGPRALCRCHLPEKSASLALPGGRIRGGDSSCEGCRWSKVCCVARWEPPVGLVSCQSPPPSGRARGPIAASGT